MAKRKPTSAPDSGGDSFSVEDMLAAVPELREHVERLRKELDQPGGRLKLFHRRLELHDAEKARKGQGRAADRRRANTKERRQMDMDKAVQAYRDLDNDPHFARRITLRLLADKAGVDYDVLRRKPFGLANIRDRALRK